MNLWVEFDQEPFSFEAQFANLGPIEGVYFCVALEEKMNVKKKAITFINIVRDRGSHLQKQSAGMGAAVT